MRINWLTYTNERDYDRVESTLWIRGYQLFPYLEALGFECLLNAPPEAAPVAVMLRWQDDRARATADAVKRAGGRVIFDLCVNYYEPAGLTKEGYGTTVRQREEVLAMTALADVVTCASENVRAAAARYHPRAHCLPDSVDDRHFTRRKALEDFRRPRLRAAWSGTSAKAREVEPIWRALAAARMGLTLISERNPYPRGTWRWLWAKARLAYQFVPWHYRTFPDAIAAADLCLSPRNLASVYNQGHSFFKIGVFMAQGVPAVVTPVPSYVDLLGQGCGGWLCDTPADWRRTLATIARDRDGLMRRSKEARDIMAPWTTERVAQRYAELFRSISVKRET